LGDLGSQKNKGRFCTNYKPGICHDSEKDMDDLLPVALGDYEHFNVFSSLGMVYWISVDSATR